MANMFSSLFSNSRSKKMAIVIAATAALLVVALLSLAIVSIVNAVRAKAPAEEPAPAPNGIPAGFVTTTFAANQLYKGNLILVNDVYAYNAEANADVATKKFGESRTKVDEKNIYFASNQYFDVNADAMDALDAMVLDFYNNAKNSSGELYHDSNLYISNIQYGNTFTFEYYVTIKGQNEATETTFAKITKSNTYKWIFDNAYKYGFVQLFEAPDADDTETESQEHIFRYVGTAHAKVMKDKKIATFEAYLTYLRESTSASKNVSVTVDKQTYKIYYLAKDAQQIVPEKYKDAYTVSGDNMSGYIVTYCTTTTKK